jgi:hypothetical protein
VALADLDADGKLDIVVIHGSAFTERPQVGVLFGHGDGTFAPSFDRSVGYGAGAIAIGTFIEGLRPAIVTSNFDTNDLSLLASAPACTLARLP